VNNRRVGKIVTYGIGGIGAITVGLLMDYPGLLWAQIIVFFWMFFWGFYWGKLERADD
jgi:hypothetical protein